MMKVTNQKKADVIKDQSVVDHVGLLATVPTSTRWFAPYLVIQQFQRGSAAFKAFPHTQCIVGAQERKKR